MMISALLIMAAVMAAFGLAAWGCRPIFTGNVLYPFEVGNFIAALLFWLAVFSFPIGFLI